MWRALRRVRSTPTQTQLSRDQRRNNVRGAFAPATDQPVAGTHLLLVDDVYTTGATVHECARSVAPGRGGERARAHGHPALSAMRVAGGGLRVDNGGSSRACVPCLGRPAGTGPFHFSTFHAHFFVNPASAATEGNGKKLQIPGGLFQACPECGAVLHKIELEENQRVCPHCEHHFRIGARDRLGHLLDPDSFQEHDADLEPVDMLDFRAADSYRDRLNSYQKKTGLKDSAISGLGKIEGREVAVNILDFAFLGGTLGSVAGEKITRSIEMGTERGLPVISITAAGGARLHEGLFALMQMAKTSGALALHAQERLPFISVLTDPTYGGVTASFAVLGDVILAEPKAMIGFAGPRVIETTTRQDLPPGFQTAEFLEEHGLIDMIVSRKKMRATLANLLGYLCRPQVA